MLHSPLRSPSPSFSSVINLPLPRIFQSNHFPTPLSPRFVDSFSRKRPLKLDSTPLDLQGEASQRLVKKVRFARSPLEGSKSVTKIPSTTPSTPLSSRGDCNLNMESTTMQRTSSSDGIPVSQLSLDDPVIPGPSTNRTPSPPSLPPPLSLKRSNPKRLALSINFPSQTTSLPLSNVAATPVSPSSSTDGTPYTAGPPKTPAISLTIGKSKARRPNLLSLITLPPSGDDAPPTPRAVSNPYATVRAVKRIKPRSLTVDEGHNHLPQIPTRSAHPTLSINNSYTYSSSSNSHPPSHSHAHSHCAPFQRTSPSSSASTSGSTSSTPSTSPPNPTFTSREREEPYSSGPVEVLPDIYLGHEDSVARFLSSCRSRGISRVRILNVAQEIEDPFASKLDPVKSKGKRKVRLASYPSGEDQPEIEYAHLKWSHGEIGLALPPSTAHLGELFKQGEEVEVRDNWGFWEAVRWVEEGRRLGEPVIVHCQCGISRSATMVIAYIMALSAAGLAPDHLLDIRSMRDAYDYVKSRSEVIGPNFSLIYELTDFSRHLSNLLSSYPESNSIYTNWPTTTDVVESEDDWARRREAFEDSPLREYMNGTGTGIGIGIGNENGSDGEEIISPEEREGEAKMLDEAMKERVRVRGMAL